MMIHPSHLKEATRSLLASKQRTVLALIGIVIGIGSVIAMVSVGRIVQEESLRQFKEMGTDILTIEKEFGGGGGPSGMPGGPGAAGGAAAKAALRLDTILAIPSRCPGIAAVAPSVRGSGDISFNGKKLERCSPMGVTASFLNINKLTMREGRFLSDLDEQSRYCAIGSQVAAELQKQGASRLLGSKIRLGDNLFTVIGVTNEVPQGGMRRFEPNEMIYLHITTGLRVFANAEIQSITARVSPGTTNNAARDQVMAYVASLGKGQAIRITSPEEIIAQMEKQMQMFTLLLGAIGSISLIVGGVGVMNVMLVSVTERRREIGIRRALGAKRGDIKGQFLIESIILSLIGGLFGIIFGIGASWLIAHFAKWQFALSFSAILLGVGVSNAVGIFFGYYPARQASLLDPIVALKSD
jgi:putative ABC transport system permease protein